MHLLHRARFAFVILLWAVGCGRSSAPAPVRSEPFAPPETSPEAARIQVVSDPERPTLKLVHRAGDPEGGVAMAVFTEGGSRSTIGLLALLHARLTTQENLSVRAFSTGLVVSALTPSAALATEAMKRFSGALRAPLGKEERVEILADKLLAKLPKVDSRIDGCLGVLGGDEPSREPFTQRELEKIRSEHAVSMRVGWGALGSPELLSAVQKTHQDQSWPKGSMVSVPSFDASHLKQKTGPLRQIRFALATPRVNEALVALEELEDREHPLRAHLAAEAGRYGLATSRIAVQPFGACLALTLDQEPGARAPKAEDLAALIRVTQKELSFALDVAAPKRGSATTLLTPETAQDALALAAWTAPPSPVLQGEYSSAEVVLGSSDGLSVSAISKELARLEKRELGEHLEIRRKDEAGQGESWLLLASPCGTAPESVRESGFRELTVRSLALDFDGVDDVTVEPWATPTAMGLLAHAPRRYGESTRHHAMRIARTLGRALGGDALDGREVAAARARLISEVGDAPGPKLALDVMSGGKPSLFEPRGNSEALSNASSADVERVRAELASEPLRVAFLDNSGQDQAGAVREALGIWLDRSTNEKARCPSAAPAAAKPGVWTLVSPSDGVVPRTYIGLPTSGSVEAGRGLVFLLEREGGFLTKGLLEPGLALTASPRYLGSEGGGLFLFELGAERDRLEDAEKQLRAILHRLSERGLTSAELELVQKEQARRDQELRRLPRGRIVELWSGPSRPLSREQLLEHLRHFRAAEHRIFRVRTER